MAAEDAQAEFKGDVKRWLKSHRLDYRWMANQCGVSEITVRNWMSQKPIPALKQQLIERVMVQLPAGATQAIHNIVPGVEVETSISLTVKLTSSLYAQLEEKANAQNLTLSAMVAQELTRLAKEAPSPVDISALKTRKVILPSGN